MISSDLLAPSAEHSFSRACIGFLTSFAALATTMVLLAAV
jgi:hypothetical protein